MTPSIPSSNAETFAVSHPREYRLFWALDDDGDDAVLRSDVARVLEVAGLTRKDRRLAELYEKLDRLGAGPLDMPAFLDVVRSSGTLLERVLQGDLALPDFARLSERVRHHFEEVEKNTDGQQATYIPPLAEVNPDQFGMAIMSIDGQLLELGDTEIDFSLQSACKPSIYCIALDELGEEAVHRHVGMEPSGQPFNARVLIGDGTGRPHNPMVNAGAIMTSALIKRDQALHRRLEYVRHMWSKMTGGAVPRFDAWMAQEESRTGDNNRALGYMMKAAGVLPHGEDAVDHELRDALELYFSMCSLAVNARELATVAATLANSGVCPVTEERVFEESTVRNCLTMMQMCGMYDGSGEFGMTIGVPGKSGVGGAVFLVVPRLMGVCIWSPRLDAVGNSIRGVEMAKRLSHTYTLHVYDGVAPSGGRIDPRITQANRRASITSSALRAGSIGDQRTLQRLSDEPANLRTGDYDLRTPIHLAAAEGHLDAVRFLLDHSADPNIKDRWGGTPLDDAALGGHTDVVELLKSHGAEAGVSEHLVTGDGPTEPPEQYGDVDGIVELLWAATENDIAGIRTALAKGIPASAADYDGRTALHLAAAEGQIETVRFLLAHGHRLHVRDRWGSTPQDEAKREQHESVAELLAAAAKAVHGLYQVSDNEGQRH